MPTPIGNQENRRRRARRAAAGGGSYWISVKTALPPAHTLSLSVAQQRLLDQREDGAAAGACPLASHNRDTLTLLLDQREDGAAGACYP